MTQEEKLLLLKDLCARFIYGVVCQFIWTYSNETTNGESVITKEDDNIRCIDVHTKEIQADYYEEWVDLEHCKPYLRPMRSITEEEIKELSEIDMKRLIFSSRHLTWHLDGEIIDYLNKKMLDWRGLIPRGLAIEAPEGMYK